MATSQYLYENQLLLLQRANLYDQTISLCFVQWSERIYCNSNLHIDKYHQTALSNLFHNHWSAGFIFFTSLLSVKILLLFVSDQNQNAFA